jgi:hypothetical protein
MRKYGLLVYQYLSVFQDRFSVITIPWDAVQVWPCANPITITDKQGQTQHQWPLTVMFKIVEDDDWGTDQDEAVNQAVTLWNAANLDRHIPETFQLVFTEAEAQGIKQIFETERNRLIALLP